MIWVEVGKTVSVDKIHVSKLNVRVEDSFGESDEDHALIENLRKGTIVHPFKARPEGDGYGVYVGRRRFLAKKAIGTKLFIVGKDIMIDQVDDDQARKESGVENLSLFRKEMDPWTRARSLQQIIDVSMVSLRTLGKELGVPHNTLSEYVSILQLHGDWERLIREGKLDFFNALKLVRLKLGELQEEELAKVLDVEGLDAYYAALAKITGGKVERRGVPRGKYVVIRTTLEKRSKDDMKLFEGLEKLAKARNQQVNEYAKDVLREHVKKALL